MKQKYDVRLLSSSTNTKKNILYSFEMRIPNFLISEIQSYPELLVSVRKDIEPVFVG